MKFWDASALVPLLVLETSTRLVQALARRDPDMLVWWGSEVECASALARLERASALDLKAAASAFNRLRQLAEGWHEIEPSEIIRESAVRFLRVHSLRAGDALQLAAAFIAAERRPYRWKLSPLTSASPTRCVRKVSWSSMSLRVKPDKRNSHLPDSYWCAPWTAPPRFCSSQSELVSSASF